jgi:hypothetical protein
MLVALNRRVPRTKSVFDRTSSRRYSSVDCDINGFEPSTNGYHPYPQSRINIPSIHLNLIDSILPTTDQGADELFATVNGHDDMMSVFDEDIDHPNLHEYACFITLLLCLTKTKSFAHVASDMIERSFIS